MKELTPLNTDPVKQEERHIIKQNAFLGSRRMPRGHRMYEFSLVTGVYAPAVFESVAVELSGEVRKKLVQKPHCLYVSALNEKNLIKKLKKIKISF